jgi:hypothetical protein
MCQPIEKSDFQSLFVPIFDSPDGWIKNCTKSNGFYNDFGILIEDGSYFIVKHKRTKNETKEYWLSFVQGVYKKVSTPRNGKTVYIGSTWKPVYKKCFFK